MKFIRDFLSNRTNIIELLIVAVMITLGINLITSAIFNILKFENKDNVLLIIGLSIVLLSGLYFVFKISWKTKILKEFSGFVIFDKQSKLPADCDGYDYMEELRRNFKAAFAENKALEHIWNNDPKKNKDSLVIEATEYYLIDDLSTHLTDYFNLKKLDKKQLKKFSRNDIPDILLSNRFLELFSKPMEQRASFISDKQKDKSPGRVVMSYGKGGELFKEFDFVLPKSSKISRSDNCIFIDTKRFIISLSVDYGGYGTVLPRGFEKYYLGYKNFEDFSTLKIEVKISVQFKFNSLFSLKGWDYYEWIELFLEKVERNFSKNYFFSMINRQQIYTQIKINENK
jgi:hypothetical protein